MFLELKPCSETAKPLPLGVIPVHFCRLSFLLALGTWPLLLASVSVVWWASLTKMLRMVLARCWLSRGLVWPGVPWSLHQQPCPVGPPWLHLPPESVPSRQLEEADGGQPSGASPAPL